MSLKRQRGSCGPAPKNRERNKSTPPKTFLGESLLIQLDDRPVIYSFRARCAYQPQGRRLSSCKGYPGVAGFGAAFPYRIHPNRPSGGPAPRAVVPPHASIELVSFDANQPSVMHARVERPHGGYMTARDHAGVGGSEGDPRHSNRCTSGGRRRRQRTRTRDGQQSRLARVASYNATAIRPTISSDERRGREGR
jgi:hypothetical protein